jgi:hypothetical protein
MLDTRHKISQDTRYFFAVVGGITNNGGNDKFLGHPELVEGSNAASLF